MIRWPWNPTGRSAENSNYVSETATTSRCMFSTPERGYREHVVMLTVDEIEDLILAVDKSRREGTHAD
jgi:hypothetical protein